MQIQPNSPNAHVAGAIRQAAHTTGASFDYLLTTAQIESNLNPNARASTSTATGLFQFIDQTWFATMKTAGPALGYARFADAIAQGPDGRFEVSDSSTRDAIMKLRSDPKVSAMMAGAFSRSNAAQLAGELGRPPSEGELYIAHFMGADGASRLINTAISRPNARAADVFPQAAGANRPIFYDRSGNARSVVDVYRVLTDRYEVARAGTSAVGLRGTLPPDASVPRPPMPIPAKAQVQVQPLPPPRGIAPTVIQNTVIHDTAGVARAFADANVRPRVAQEGRPLFQAMFTSRGNDPVAPAVRDLWTPASAPPAPRTPNDFNLFTDPARPPGRPQRSGT